MINFNVDTNGLVISYIWKDIDYFMIIRYMWKIILMYNFSNRISIHFHVFCRCMVNDAWSNMKGYIFVIMEKSGISLREYSMYKYQDRRVPPNRNLRLRPRIGLRLDPSIHPCIIDIIKSKKIKKFHLKLHITSYIKIRSIIVLYDHIT